MNPVRALGLDEFFYAPVLGVMPKESSMVRTRQIIRSVLAGLWLPENGDFGEDTLRTDWAATPRRLTSQDLAGT